MSERVYEAYPTRSEVDAWAGEILETARKTPLRAELLSDDGVRGNCGPFHMCWRNRLVKLTPEGMEPFFGLWQPVQTGPAPLVFHVPGYGAELSNHPDTVAQGVNVLSVSPLGYWTPEGFDVSKQRDGNWPVLPDTLRTGAQGGYRLWLLQCAMAVLWAWGQPQTLPERVSFYGTSQGGGGSLLLGSLFAGRGTRCVAADEPFLTDYVRANWRGAYDVAKAAFDEAADKNAAWKALGLADTLSHAHRMAYPVLLTEGGADDVCPPDTIDHLYELLPSTKSKTWIGGKPHGYTYEFMNLAWAWFRLFA